MAHEPLMPGPDSPASPQGPRQGNRVDRPNDDEDTIDLSFYVRLFERRWKTIVSVAILGGAVGFGLATQRPLRYEGFTTLLVTPPTQPSGVQMNPATFRGLAENGTLVKQVIDELGLNTFTPQRFLERALRVDEIRGSSLVRITVTLEDPAKAAEASRLLAQKAVALSREVAQRDGVSIQDQLKGHLDDARERMARAERELLTYKQAAQVDVIKGDTDAQLRERGELLELVIDIAAERARLSAAEAEIGRLKPVLEVPRMPSAEEALRRSGETLRRTDEVPRRTDETARRADETARRADGTPRRADETPGRTDEIPRRRDDAPRRLDQVDPPPPVDLTNPFVNPVYQTLEYQIATSRTRVAALEKQRDEMVNVRKLGGAELREMNELYKREVEQARLQAEFDMAMKVYGDLVLRFEQSRTQPFATTAQLQIVDLAQPAETPLPRRRAIWGIYGAAVGAVAGMAFALFRTEPRRG